MKTDYEYRTFTDKELEEKIEELKLMIMKTHTFTEGKKGVKESGTNLRKEIARIKTELRKRQNPKTPL